MVHRLVISSLSQLESSALRFSQFFDLKRHAAAMLIISVQLGHGVVLSTSTKEIACGLHKRCQDINRSGASEPSITFFGGESQAYNRLIQSSSWEQLATTDQQHLPRRTVRCQVCQQLSAYIQFQYHRLDGQIIRTCMSVLLPVELVLSPGRPWYWPASCEHVEAQFQRLFKNETRCTLEQLVTKLSGQLFFLQRQTSSECMVWIALRLTQSTIASYFTHRHFF